MTPSPLPSNTEYAKLENSIKPPETRQKHCLYDDRGQQRKMDLDFAKEVRNRAEIESLPKDQSAIEEFANKNDPAAAEMSLSPKRDHIQSKSQIRGVVVRQCSSLEEEKKAKLKCKEKGGEDILNESAERLMSELEEKIEKFG